MANVLKILLLIIQRYFILCFKKMIGNKSISEIFSFNKMNRAWKGQGQRFLSFSSALL